MKQYNVATWIWTYSLNLSYKLSKLKEVTRNSIYLTKAVKDFFYSGNIILDLFQKRFRK